MDFYTIQEREVSNRRGVVEVFPNYQVRASNDLLIRGGKFYAVWNEDTGLWSTNELDVVKAVDRDIRAYEVTNPAMEITRRTLQSFGSNTWQQFRLFCTTLPDSKHDLDQKVVFANSPVEKKDYASHRLPYDMKSGPMPHYEELVSKLYSPEERAKFEWAIGSIIAGESKTIHKALVFFGKPGEGKSTILDIIEDLFEGYTFQFEVADLVSQNNQFSVAQFKDNSLVAVDQDGDLSKVMDNSKLNKLIAHDKMVINEKHKAQYEIRSAAMLFIGTNKPVRITDAKSGLTRRILDVRPTGELHSATRYQALVKGLRFELGAIAQHCYDVFQSMGRDYYAGYIPLDMMMQTDVFFNFIEYHFDIFEEQDGVSLKQAWSMWKEWQDETRVKWDMPYHKFREELKNYFDSYEDRASQGDARVRNWYSGFNASKYKQPSDETVSDPRVMSLVLEETTSLFDTRYKDAPAQYANSYGTPYSAWDGVTTTLKDLDTSKEHYVLIPEHEIVIDFDLVDEHGEKDRQRNLEAAALWPPTYAELSKSGAGVHLHYNWTGGDPKELQRVYSPGVEVKVYTGHSSLRRKLSRCNATPVADLNSGLALKEKKTVIDQEIVATEKGLRTSINKALRKEVHDSTKPNIDFIHHVLDEAYNSGMTYDVSDMRNRVLSFALKSTNQQQNCLKAMQTMKFKSEERDELGVPSVSDDEIPVIFDVEVFPNLFVVCWKYSGSDEIVTLVNPKPQEIERLMALKLVGFNNRGYDNHILYAASMGYNNEQLFQLSKNIIDNQPNAKFGAAYSVSFTDILDFSSKKQSLKKWEIELGIKHLELGLPWDDPVPKELWDKVVEYCKNDVEGTDAVFQHLRADYIARQILADLSGLSMNATTQQHTAKIIFGNERNPQGKFNYRDLGEIFHGYTYSYDHEKKAMVSVYRGEEIGEGGLVRSKPGIYTNVALLDIASMHPTSIEILDLFGEYTKHFSALKEARLAIKHKDYDTAKKLLGGKLAPHLTDEEQAEALSHALKIVINIVYGLTAASFDNAFKDPRNVDNIVAKIGALFMLDLMYAVEEKGFDVIHVKTDSLKIPNATPEIIQFIFEYGAEFGYTFEHEATYEKMVLVNDAVYAARVGWALNPKKIGTWDTVGAQFQHPYVKKKLFTKEKIVFRDLCEAKSVRTSLWLDYEGEDVPMALSLTDGTMQFIGKTGLFTPVKPGAGGGLLLREKEGKYSAATGSSGYRWMESEMVKELHKEKDVDMSYFDGLVDKALDNIGKYGDAEQFCADN